MGTFQQVKFFHAFHLSADRKAWSALDTWLLMLTDHGRTMCEMCTMSRFPLIHYQNTRCTWEEDKRSY